MQQGIVIIAAKIMGSNEMVHSLFVTITLWLATYATPTDIVSVYVTSCMPPKHVCLISHKQTHE